MDRVSLSYTAGGLDVPVLKGASLEIEQGQSVAIIGPSGSGKTSLLLVLTGLETPSSGVVKFEGASLQSLSNDERADLRRDQMGIVFQSFHLIQSLSASENVALPLEIAGVSGARERASEILDRVGLGHRMSHYPNALSGGEQQRVAIARALIHQPALIVADEPTGNLDDATGAEVADLIFELNEESDSTLLLVTHDQNLAARCQRQVRLQEGLLQPVEGPSSISTGNDQHSN